MQKLSGEMGAFRRRLKAVESDPASQRQVVDEMRAFMTKHKVNPLLMLPSMVAQMGIFMSIFFAFRTLAREAHLLPGFMEGGTGDSTSPLSRKIGINITPNATRSPAPTTRCLSCLSIMESPG